MSKSQFHHDYPKVILLLFMSVVGYFGQTIFGILMAYCFVVWICFIILCNVLRLLKYLTRKL